MMRLLSFPIGAYPVSYQLIRFARVCSHVDDLMLVINVLLLNFSNKVIGIISLTERFVPSSIADIMNWFQNSKSD